MKPPFIRSPYNYDTNKVSDETGLDTGTEGGAKQSFKEECDINTIIKRFGLGYELPHDVRIPTSGDYTDITDFHSAMTAVRQAQESFNALPAEVRSFFGNNPEGYVDYCLDERNVGRLGELGLLNENGLKRLQELQEANLEAEVDKRLKARTARQESAERPQHENRE